jgi:K+ transporter
VRLIGVAIVHPSPDFPHLAWAPPIALTAILEIGAILVFYLVARISKRPFRTYLVVSVVVLILTFIPDAAEPIYGLVPGATWPTAIVLMIMHLVAWAITVTMLFRLTAPRSHSHDIVTGRTPWKSRQRTGNRN